MSTIRVTEEVYTGNVSEQIDRENGIIRGVKILGKISANGRVYSDAAMSRALPMYEGMKVNIDHADSIKAAENRRMTDAFGWFSAVEMKTDGLYGDLNYIRSHPDAEPVLEWTERNPKGLGMSHVAMCGYGKGKDRVVEHIEKVISVDLVGCPATTAGMFEEVREEPEKMKTSLKRLVESHGSQVNKENLKTFFEHDGRDASVVAVLESEFEIDEAADDAQFSDLLSESTRKLVSNAMDGTGSPEDKGALVKSISLAESIVIDGLVVEEQDTFEHDSELSRLKAEVAMYKRREKARSLIESKGMAVTPILVDAVARFEKPSEQELLLESFRGGSSKPAASPGKNSDEGETQEYSWEAVKAAR